MPVTSARPVWQPGFSQFLVAGAEFQPVGEILPPA